MNGHLRDNVQFFWKGIEIFGHETIESKKMLDGDEIVAVVKGMATDEANMQSTVENVQNSDRAEQIGMNGTVDEIMDTQDKENNKPTQETLQSTLNAFNQVKTFKLRKQEDMEQPVEKMCENQLFESNAEKMRRLEPMVTQFLLKFKRHGTFTTEANPEPTTNYEIETTEWENVFEELQKSMDQMESDLADRIQRFKIEHAKEIQTLQDHNKSLKFELEENTTKIATLQQKQEKWKNEVEEVEKRMNQMQTEHANEIELAGDEIQRLKKELQTKELDHAEEIQTLQDHNKTLKLELEENTTEIATLRTQKDGLRNEICEMKKKHENELQIVKTHNEQELRKNMDDWLKGNEELRKQLEENNKKNATLQTQVDGLRSEICGMKKKHENELQQALQNQLIEINSNHANEVEAAKIRATEELQRQFHERLKQIYANEANAAKIRTEELQRQFDVRLEQLYANEANAAKTRTEELQRQFDEQLKQIRTIEVEAAKTHVTKELQKCFDERLKQIQAQSNVQMVQTVQPMHMPEPVACSSGTNANKRSCANCGKQSRRFSTFTYCNTQCKQNYLKTQYESMHPLNLGPH